MSKPTGSNSNTLIRGHLDLLLLSVLRKKRLSGAGIISEARSRSSEYFDLRSASVYPALHRLEQAGLILNEEAQTLHRGKTFNIKVYTLTNEGHHELDARRRAFLVFSKHLASLWDPG